MKRLALAGSSVLVLLLTVELALRLAGVEPWTWQSGLEGMPSMSRRDPELGWVARPGSYRYRHGDRTITTTIGEDGSRGQDVGEPGSDARPEIWFTGASYTQGWGIDDGDDLASLVAAQLPDMHLRNFAVPGYATLQAKLLYERTIEREARVPQLVVYGYAFFHDYRNTAATYWLLTLKRSSNVHEWIEVPYAQWQADKGLRTFPPKGYPKWPLSEYSALLQLMQTRVAALGQLAPPREQARVTLELVSRWHQRVADDGSELVVMTLLAFPGPKQRRFEKALDERDIAHFACPKADFPSPETTLADAGHPNELAHRRWADCFIAWLAGRAAPAGG
jgi:hypothetical protein